MFFKLPSNIEGIDPFVRALIQGVNLRPLPSDAYPTLLRELSDIGNNVNLISFTLTGCLTYILQQKAASGYQICQLPPFVFSGAVLMRWLFLRLFKNYHHYTIAVQSAG